MICYNFFCIYVDEDQESPSSQADTTEGRMGYVICNLNLMKKVLDMLFVTEIGIHVAYRVFFRGFEGGHFAPSQIHFAPPELRQFFKSNFVKAIKKDKYW